MHLADSPGSCFACLKDCLEEWSKNKKLECTLSMAEQKLVRMKLNMYYKITKHLDAIGLTTRIELLQKAALLGTAHLLRRVLEA